MRPLELKQEMFNMPFLEDLGSKLVGIKTKVKKRMGLFQCNCCEQEFEANVINAKNNKTGWCYDCSHDWSKNKNISDLDRTGREPNNKTHGETKTRLYGIWGGMVTRCTNQNRASWKDYGGRGIKCDDFKDFVVFREWALSNGYSDDLSLDRINVDSDYSFDNCRWVDRCIQAQNTRPRFNKTGATGISYHEKIGKYEPYIANRGIRHYLGVYETIDEAISVRNDFIIKNKTEHTLSHKGGF